MSGPYFNTPSKPSRAAFDAQLAQFNRRAEAHNRGLLLFLAASPYGEGMLQSELARQGICRAAFDRSRTIHIKAEPVMEEVIS